MNAACPSVRQSNFLLYGADFLTKYEHLGWDLNELGWDLNELGWDLNELGWDINELGWDLKSSLPDEKLSAAFTQIIQENQ